MNVNQKAIKVMRQLDSEFSLLDELKLVCDQFSEMLRSADSTPLKPVDMKPAEKLLGSFAERARQVVNARQKTMNEIQTTPGDGLTIRQFIQSSQEPLRSQLEGKRRGLIDRLHSLKTQLNGDASLVFYSFDFYRRIVNRLVDCIGDEQNYDERGNAAQQSSGKFIQRTC